MDKARYLGVVIMMTCLGQAATAQDTLPTDSELHSAYCIPVLQRQIKWYREEIIAMTDKWVTDAQTPELKQQALNANNSERKSVSELESALNRLQLYLLPRMEHRDVFALAAAQRRGQTDVQDFFQKISENCAIECGAESTGPTDEKKRACMESCANKNATVVRIKACANPTWLPF